MTRINADIPVKVLSDNHLRAEQKEIARLPLLFATKRANKTLHQGIPLTFTLGQGHLSFFMDKGQWVLARWFELTEECQKRNLAYRDMINPDLWAEYDESSTIKYRWSNSDRILVINRIIEKMLPKMRERENYGLRFMGEKESVEQTLQRLLTCIK